MNELDLIKEVEKRPILFDKSVSGFNKTKLRDEAWRKVSEALDVTETECKKRWRSLRDSFIKLQRTHAGRTRWPYQNAMRFLMPHVDPKPEHTKVSQRRSRKDPESSDEEEEEQRQRAIQCLPDLSFMTQEGKYEDDSPAPSPKKQRLNSSDEENSNQCLCNRSDPDELFLLSCASTLKRLHSKQNAVARLKIQQALYEAEFGVQAENGTPPTNEGFGPIE